MTALINSESGNGDKERGYNAKVAECVEEAASMGLRIKPPCVIRSDAYCTPDFKESTLRFGLAMIKNVSESAVKWIGGHCRGAMSFKDFLLSCHEIIQDDKGKHKAQSRVGKAHIESLIAAGAFDMIDPMRQRLKMMLIPLQELIKSYLDQKCKVMNGSRVRKTPESVKQAIDDYQINESDVEQLSLEYRLEQEKLITGCYLSDSPFAPHRMQIRQYDCVTLEQIEENDYGDHALFAAILRDYREITCKNGKSKGKNMAFLTWSTVSGDIETVCFPDTWAGVNVKVINTDVPLVQRGKVYLVRVKPDRNGKAPNFDGLTRLSNVSAMAA